MNIQTINKTRKQNKISKQIKKKSSQINHGFNFVLTNYYCSWGLPWNVVDKFKE